MATTQPIRDKQQVNRLITYYQNKEDLRNHLLIVVSIFTALRISDILRLSWSDVYDFKTKRVLENISITEHKTGKNKIIALNAKIISALKRYSEEATPGKPLFINKNTGKAISRVQAYRIIRAAAESARIADRVSCHSLRKTLGYHAWKNGTSPAVIMAIYNHSSFAVTRRYLGVAQDDKNEVYVGLNFYTCDHVISS